MFIFGGTVDNNVRSGEMYRFQFSSYPKCTLHDDFGQLLGNEELCDVEFMVGEDEPVRVVAHLALVCARSNYLAQLVKQCKEARDDHLERLFGTVDVPFKDVPKVHVHLPKAVPDAFTMVLNYIYTDKIDPTKVCF